jgi:malonyl CoA-acyl carrier protein transacylase
LLQSVEQEVEHLLQASTGSKRRKSNATTKEEKKNAPSTTHMITNINGTLQHDWTSICSDLSKQTCETVKWVRCMDTAIEGTDVETWYEVGPGVALSNLMKRHMPKHYHCSNAIELIQAL